ncbi:MAG: ABC transporter permease [Planctomycetota bacterium]
MIEQFLAIVRNTLFESIRQPIMLVLLLVGAILIVLSNLLAGFTMENDQKMFIDIGLATVFLFGALLASFIATSVLTREIENKTALTVVSKPVSRTIYVLGKYAGVAIAMIIGVLFLGFVFLLVEQHQVIETVRDPVHAPVIVFGVVAFLLGTAVGIWSNYFYNKAFPSTFIVITTFLLGLAYVLSLMFDAGFRWQDPTESFRPQLILALIVLVSAALILTAIAFTASTRVGQVMTLCITLGMFLFGLLSDAIFGAPMAQLEQTWSKRVEALPAERTNGPSLATIGQEIDIADLRAWMRDVRRDEAATQREVAELELQESVAEQRMLRERNPEEETAEDFDIRIRNLIEREEEAIAREYESRVTRIDDDIDAIELPLETNEIAVRVDQARIFRLITDEFSVETDRVLRAYPPAIAAVRQPQERFVHAACRVGYAIVPNFQVMLLSDAVTQSHRIPPSYVLRTVMYGVIQILLYLSLAIMLFQKREVG